MALESRIRVEELTANWPHYDEDEISAVLRVLQSGKVNYWTGQEGRLFEKEFASFAGTKHAVAMANGTVTLECLLRSLNLKSGDEVIVTPRSFIASASSVVMQGGKPVFADVDHTSGNLSAQTIEPRISSRTKAIIVVHLAGWPAEMDPIMDLAISHDLFVIEDCAQAHGAKYRGKSVGSLGHAGSWSFCQDKIISTVGEGGMITTNDSVLWSKCWSLKDHGKSFDAVYNKVHPVGFRWLHESIGTNWRLPEVQSAVGRIQLTKLADWTQKRTNHARILSDTLIDLSLVRTEVPPAHMSHAYYKYYCYLNQVALRDGWNRERILETISSYGVPAFSGSCSEIYNEVAFKSLGIRSEESCKVAHELGETSMMFLVHPTLTSSKMTRCAEIIRSVLKEATR